MWHWDQGRIAYFQFDAIRAIANFVISRDFKHADREELQRELGLPFAAPHSHSPWRNYSRTLKLSLLVYESGDLAIATPIADILAKPGLVTCDEYFHFLLSSFSDPSPALQGWTPNSRKRYPLLFSIKYILTKLLICNNSFSSLDEIIGAYGASNFDGSEDDEMYSQLMPKYREYENMGRGVNQNLRRQAKESIKVLAQISYLHVVSGQIVVTLSPDDALEIFQELQPIVGLGSNTKEEEILRISKLFSDGSHYDFFGYPHTIVNDVVESGFSEGNKVNRTHVTIERNAGLRSAFFESNPTTSCDVCKMDTKKSYPWTNKVLDIHHLLPLSSGTRVESKGTIFSDLVPVCPNCHRAIHRYYEGWLRKNHRADFEDSHEACSVYRAMKEKFTGHIYAN